MGFEVVERPFTVAEAHDAREAFLTSTSSLVLPVTAIDGRTVANGHARLGHPSAVRSVTATI